MVRIFRASIVPLVTFMVAVVTAVYAAPPTSFLTLRAPQQTTGECRHERFQDPAEDSKKCTVDGVAGAVEAPKIGDFNPTRNEKFNQTLECVVKSQDGSLTLNARTLGTRIVAQTRNATAASATPQVARVGFRVIDSFSGNCCHSAALWARGVVSGRLRIGPGQGLATLAFAHLGAVPMTQGFTAQASIRYDHNCNGVEDGFDDDVQAVGFVEYRNVGGAFPRFAAKFVVLDVTTTEIIDGNRVFRGINRAGTNGPKAENAAGGVAFHLHLPYGFEFPKNISHPLTYCRMEVSKGEVRAHATETAIFAGGAIPDVSSDVTFNTGRLREVDITEKLEIEIKKKNP